MRVIGSASKRFGVVAAFCLAALSAGCGLYETQEEPLPEPGAYEYEYIIGPGDELTIFVWRNPDVSTTATVRPDGKISVPLVEDLVVGGKTPAQAAREIEGILSRYIKDPLVTVMVGGFLGVYETQIRVVGEAANPQAIPFRAGMTVLDLMIAVGGLTEFADGNEARLVRVVDGQQRQVTVKLEDLIKDGDIAANVPLAPGDILIIPEAWF